MTVGPTTAARRLVATRLVGVVALTTGALLVGCGIRPDRVEAVVTFLPSATTQQQDALRSACPSIGQALQEPPDRNNLASSRAYPLRYDITRASAQDKSALYRCVNGHAGVQGISEESNSG